jgi:NTP pyrophosphatase (non-canonical NTP hydrolase)
MKDRLDGVDPRMAVVEIQKQCGEDSRRWFPEVGPDLAFHALAIAGEAGEFANLVKKVARGSLDANVATTRYALTMELVDIFTYVMNTADIMHVNLYEAYKIKRAENEARFGPGREAVNGS